MTTHEMAKMLLSGPDVPVLIPIGEPEDGALSPPSTVDGRFAVRQCVSGNEDERWDAKGELVMTDVVILSPGVQR